MSEDDLRIFNAIEFAAKAHSGQYRRGSKVPYIIHPLGVAKILLELGLSTNLAIAGILHDTVEDCEVSIEEIENKFGKQIAKLVAHTTELPQKTHEWKVRKEHTIKHMKTAPKNALLVCCADKLHNVQSLLDAKDIQGEELWHSFYGTKADQKWYYSQLLKLFKTKFIKGKELELVKKYELTLVRLFG